MGRTFADGLALFCLPFMVYGIAVLFGRRFPAFAAGWTQGRAALLALVGLALVGLGLLMFGLLAPRHQGGYAPARIENGQVVPGRLE